MLTRFFVMGLILTGFIAHAQPDTTRVRYRQSVYFELGGNGASLGLNYDRPLRTRSAWTYGLRAGVAYGRLSIYNARLVTEAYVFRGLKQHHAELGLGFTWITPNQFMDDNALVRQSGALFMVPRLGYRYQKPGRATVLRIGIMPWVSITKNDRKFLPWWGFAWGQAF